MNGCSLALINLMRGWPNPALLPVAQIKAASVAALSDPAIAIPGLLYGPDPGFQPLRDQVAVWLTIFYKPPRSIAPDRICVTGGASQNLANILQVYTDPLYTKNIWISSPTYYLACRIFQDSGFYGRLRSVPEDHQGIDVDLLKIGLQLSEKENSFPSDKRPTLKPQEPYAKIYRHIIYVVPTFSNPSSKTMSVLRREELVTIAREFDALIITDDVYDHLQWPASSSAPDSRLEEAVCPRIVDVDCSLDNGAERAGADGFGNTVSNGSFSKIAGPGCRTGWAEGTAKFAYGLSQVGSSRSGGAPSQLTATSMFKLLETGELQRHIFDTLQPSYARRYHKMISAIEQHLLPLGVTLPQSDRDVVGGYFVWFSLPDPLEADQAALRAQHEENVIIAPGSLFEVFGDAKDGDLKRQIRLSFSWEEEEQLSEGIERLARVIRRMLAEERTGQGAAVAAHLPTNGKIPDINQNC